MSVRESRRITAQETDFETFKTHLRATPENIVIGLLNLRLVAKASDLLEAVQFDPRSRAGVEIQYAFLADAKRLALSGDTPTRFVPKFRRRLPEWQSTAQSELASFIDNNPTERAALSQSVFFSNDSGLLDVIDHHMMKSTVPSGAYDRVSLAAGIATGYITLELESI